MFMASSRVSDMEAPVRKITVRIRRKEDAPTASESLDNIMSSTSASPLHSPKRIRVILPRDSTRKPRTVVHDYSDLSTVSSAASPVHWREPSIKLESLVEAVARELWNRECLSTPPNFGKDFKHIRLTALWYIRLYFSSLLEPIPTDQELAVGLASIFITFKAADFIPGQGRVKMNQLIDAYERSSGLSLSDPETSLLIDRVCRTEMDVMCLCGFDFNPLVHSIPRQ